MANGLSKSKLTGAAVAAIAAAYAVAPMTATAKDPIPAQCQGIGDELPRLRCARTYWQQRGADAIARGKAADARGAAADASTKCIEGVTKRIKQAGPLSDSQKAAFKAEVLACG